MKLIQVIDAYVTLQRSLGKRFKAAAKLLRQFDREMGCPQIGHVRPEAVANLLHGTGTLSATWTLKYRVLSGLYKFAISRGHTDCSPLPTSLPKLPPQQTPYVYSTDELRRLLDATTSLYVAHSRLQAPMYRTLLLLLYGSGLRIGEALGLSLRDVDLSERIIVVRNTKFFKTRLVPIGPKLTQELAAHIERRRQLPLPTGDDSPLFTTRTGRGWPYQHVITLFQRVRQVAGIDCPAGEPRPPRLHDFRQTAAVHRVLAWYRSGKDVQRLLPQLATYLGHANLIGPWIRRFLLEHMVTERNLARNTQASYRDPLTLLLPFVSTRARQAIDRMAVEDLTPAIVRQFLNHLERDRHCSGVTRNQRLATIHSLARFIGMRSPVHLSWCAEIRSIPFKKTAKTVIGYLEKDEIDALLNQPDQSKAIGARDHTLLLFLYNSGARADEAAKLTIGSLQLGTSPSVRILGKGNELRMCPLWPATSSLLSQLADGRGASEPVFLGRTGQPMTSFGIHRLVTHYAGLASKSVPSLAAKRVSPHTIRHTTAVHLLRAGVDINTIRAWLGHVSRDTTHIYAEVDMEMKAKALARVDISDQLQSPQHRKELPSLMTFLKAL